jgi:hypothetical protein
MSSDFTLTNQERDSALWKRLNAHLESRIDMMRRQNDTSLTETETERLRGRIAFAKELQALNNTPD